MQQSIADHPQMQVVERLVTLGRLDTQYRDHYLARASRLLALDMSYETYTALIRKRTSLANLPNQIRNAMNEGDWGRVRVLSQEHESFKTELERNASLLEIAKEVYEKEEIAIDPFSPGMKVIPGVAQQSLGELRQEAKQHLKELAQADRIWQSFYLRRLEAFKRLQVAEGSVPSPLRLSSGELEQEALGALEEGNFSELARLAENLDSAKARADLPQFEEDSQDALEGVSHDYDFSFSQDTIDKASHLGLELVHVPSRHKEYAALCRFAWHPTFPLVQENQAGVLQVPDLHFPQETPEALKARVKLFATHPMINSAGVRFLPSLVSEDVLVETFAEPEPGKTPAASKLLEALGLQRRIQLSRRHIEEVLMAYGSRVVEQELGLDPFEFRLICIPPDLHLRIGLERGWGLQQIWTHFDGYLVMMDGSLRPLGGGDVRFGGVYDLLGLPRNYSSDRVVARFAVVQRRRMALWQ